MLSTPQAIWINVSPSFKFLSQPLLHYLSHHTTIACWDYHQTPDEPCSLDTAINLLHDYLQCCDQPLHLMGHSTGGLISLLYARKYPARVKSLSLLSVGMHPAVDWQAHYYVQRQLLSCPRELILTQMVDHLFGSHIRMPVHRLVKILEQDLDYSLSPHSLFKRNSIASGNVEVPLLVCGGEDDIVVDQNHLGGWKDSLKPCDRLWVCPNERHFFHFCRPRAVSQTITTFWESLSNPLQPSLSSRMESSLGYPSV
ncbi:MAG: alpha/beta hydrolase [Elainella sp. Prado103]|jgi:pimeloyl-ACP methyl ester carboxylesterase|nr:alpha/beta hydrolase [Elainella sp. Prado103]